MIYLRILGNIKKDLTTIKAKQWFQQCYLPTIDEQFEHNIPTLKGMLKSWVLGFGGYLMLTKFTYNYHSSIGIVPYKALYGRKSKPPICWKDLKQENYTWTKCCRSNWIERQTNSKLTLYNSNSTKETCWSTRYAKILSIEF